MSGALRIVVSLCLAGAACGSASTGSPAVNVAVPKRDYSLSSADYSPEARAAGIQGTIQVRLAVDAHGAVASRQLLSTLGYGLDEIAMERAAELEFEPARTADNTPVASVVIWTFRFVLPPP